MFHPGTTLDRSKWPGIRVATMNLIDAEGLEKAQALLVAVDKFIDEHPSERDWTTAQSIMILTPYRCILPG